MKPKPRAPGAPAPICGLCELEAMPDEDIPSPIDFHDPAQARAWVDETVRNRPYRPRFFAAFAAALNERFGHPFDILELGSGPGYLAASIFQRCPVRSYAALDFSAAMHDLAREKLRPFLDRVTFVKCDFRSTIWGEGLGSFDAVATLQSAHEMRHKRHLVPFLMSAKQKLAKSGILLYCDHYAELESGKNPDLFVERDAQPLALAAAGFSEIRRLLDEGGMALYAATNR